MKTVVDRLRTHPRVTPEEVKWSEKIVRRLEDAGFTVEPVRWEGGATSNRIRTRLFKVNHNRVYVYRADRKFKPPNKRPYACVHISYKLLSPGRYALIHLAVDGTDRYFVIPMDLKRLVRRAKQTYLSSKKRVQIRIPLGPKMGNKGGWRAHFDPLKFEDAFLMLT